jgi:hypothetical protein
VNTDVIPAILSRPSATRSPQYDPTLLGGGAVVPYIGSWTGEETAQPQIIRRRRGGIAFADEMLLDRDEWGVLWIRSTARIGVGRPLFKRLHPRRQRRAVLDLLCQVCAKPADHTDAGTLWLMPESEVHAGEDREGMTTIYPPLCSPCARLSVSMCPALRQSYVLLRARSRVAGVSGVVFRPVYPFPRLMVDDDYPDVVALGDPMLAWTLGCQLARGLVDVAVIDLESLS